MTRARHECFAAALLLSGCARAADAPRESARAAVLTTAEAVRVVDEVCASAALERHDVALARRCASFYVPARAALVATGEGVDAWERSASHEDVTCAVAGTARALGELVAELERGGVTIPPVARDALALARALGGCHGR